MPATLLRIPRVARILDVPESRAYALVRDGVIPGTVRVGRQVRVDEAKLLAWIDEGGCPSAASRRRKPDHMLAQDDACRA